MLERSEALDGSRFDEITKALASGTSRRTVLRRLGAGLAGLGLAATGRGAAQAAPNQCAAVCDQLFDEGPAQATCKQVCESCPGGVSDLCPGTTNGVTTVTCCGRDTVCCPGGACCDPRTEMCCGSTCCPISLKDRVVCCLEATEPVCCNVSRFEQCTPLGCIRR